MKRAFALLWLVFVTFLAPPPCLAKGAYDLKLQAATDFVPPGLPEGSVFQSFFNSALNEKDQIAFSATVAIPGPDAAIVRWGVFLKDESGIKKILLEGDALPTGEKFFVTNNAPFPVFSLNNNGAVAIADLGRGVLLYRSGQLRWVARPGEPAPGTAATFRSFALSQPSYSLGQSLNDRDQVAFQATLSDNSNGLFLFSDSSAVKVAVEGDAIPNRKDQVFDAGSLRFSVFRLTANDLVFATNIRASNGLFLFADGTLRTIVAPGDSIPDGTGPPVIIDFDVNSQRQVAFFVRTGPPSAATSQLFVWSEGKLGLILGKNTLVPGFPTKPPDFISNLSFTDQGRLFFTAQVWGTRGGLLLWDGKSIQKILVDGDPSPFGGAFAVGLRNDLYIGVPPPPGGYPLVFSVTRMNDSLQVVFQAEISGTETGRRTFVWKAGVIEPIEFDKFSESGIEDRLVSYFFPATLNQNGKILLRAYLCCESSDALYLAQPATARIQYLPLLAAGRDGSGLQYVTRIDAINHSVFPGFVSVEFFDALGNMIPSFAPRDFVLYGGQTRALGVAPSSLTAGYAKVQIVGAADVSLSGTLQLWKDVRLQSQAGLALGSPVSFAELVVERSARAGTGVALTNPGSVPGQLRLALLDAQGVARQEVSLLLPPGQQRSFFIDELFPGLPADFLGRLRVTADSPFLIAGLRLSELRLSTLPVDTRANAGAYRAWGFANILPYPKNWWSGYVSQTIINARGSVAFVSVDDIKIITAQGIASVLTGETILPGTGTTRSRISPSVMMLGFNNQDEVTFVTKLEGANYGIFLWSGGKLRKTALEAEKLPDGSELHFGWDFTLRNFAAFNDQGLLAVIGSQALYLYDARADSWRTIFRSLEFIPGDSEHLWGQVRSVDLKNSGILAFATETVVGLYDGKSFNLIAKSGDLISDREIGGFITAKVSEKGALFFSAWTGSLPRQGVPGLFVFDGKSVRAALVSGDAVPWKPGFVFDQIGIPTGFPGSTAPFQISDSNTAVLLARMKTGNVSYADSAILSVNEKAQVELLFNQGFKLPAFPLDTVHISNFFLSNSNQMLLNVTLSRPSVGSRSAFLLWERGKIQKVVASGDRQSLSGAPLALFREIWSKAFSDSGLVLFESSVIGEGVTGLYLAVPDNLQQYFIPHVALGPVSTVNYQTTLLFNNSGTTSSAATVNLFSSNGFLQQSRPISLQPGETASFSFPSVDSPSSPSNFIGWAQVNILGGQTRVFERLSLLENDKLLSEVTVPAVSVASEGFWEGSHSPAVARDTGVAFANPYHAAVDVEIDLLGLGLQVKSRAKLQIPEGGHTAVLISELFPSMPLEGSLLRFSTAVPLPAITLKFEAQRITSLLISR